MKALTLKKETLMQLGDQDIEQVVGGLTELCRITDICIITQICVSRPCITQLCITQLCITQFC